METLNKIELRGVVGYCRTIARHANGEKEMNFCVATQEGIDTRWHDCRAIVKDETPLEKYCHVHLVGRIANKGFRAANGSVGYLPEIIVQSIEIINE